MASRRGAEGSLRSIIDDDGTRKLSALRIAALAACSFFIRIFIRIRGGRIAMMVTLHEK